MNIKSTKRILCFGDSLTFGKVPGPTKRYPADIRWTGVLQGLLGDRYEVIEEGLRGRTTNLDDPESIGRNGLTYFQSSVLSHLPLDLIIILLGTNDLKARFNRNVAEIASAIKEYRNAIHFACKYLEEKEPKLLIVSPPYVDEVHVPSEWGYSGSEVKSKMLGQELSKAALDINAGFINLSLIVEPSKLDGIHIDEAGHSKVAHVLASKITEIINAID